MSLPEGMKTYEQFRDALVAGRAAEEAARAAHARVVDRIKVDLAKPSEEDIQLAESFGIRFNALKLIDLNRLAVDAGYHKEICELLAQETAKLHKLLEEILQ